MMTRNLEQHVDDAPGSAAGRSFLSGGGEAGALARSVDWSKTPLGPVDAWPNSLKTTLSILFHSRHPMFLWWGPQLIQFYNDAYLPSFGKGKHPAAMGQPGRECWMEIWPIIWPQIDDVMRRGTPSWNEDHLVPIFRNGRIEEVYWTYGYSPVYDEAGGVGGTLVVCTETTSRMVAERRLRTVHALTEKIARAGDLTNVTQSAAEVLGSAAQDLPFALIYLLDSRSGEPRLAEAIRMSPGEAPVLRAPASPTARRLAALASQVVSSGSALHVSTADFPELRGGPTSEPVTEAFIAPLRALTEHSMTGFILFGISPRLSFDDAYSGFFMQLTSQLANALAVQQSHALAEIIRQDLNDFFIQVPAPMCILTGPDHVFTLANDPYLALVGRDVQGKAVRAAFSQEEAGAFFQLLDGVYQTGIPHLGKELPFRRSDEHGVMRDHLLNIGYHPFRTAEGRIKGVLAYVEDVTEQVTARRRAETLAGELQLAVAARDTFLGIASHELKTPLTSLKLQVQMNKRAFEKQGMQAFGPQRLQKLLENTARQSERLTRLVDDMLDISRIAAGKLAMNPEQTSLSSLTKETVERFAPELSLVNSTLRLDVAPSVEGYWDPYRLEQVLTNLITNAIRYAPGAPVHVSLSARAERAVLSVRDHGPGIPPHSLKKIFERFERLESGNEGGLGLGLFICRHIVEAHGGMIYAESELGKGTNFVFELPSLPESAVHE